MKIAQILGAAAACGLLAGLAQAASAHEVKGQTMAEDVAEYASSDVEITGSLPGPLRGTLLDAGHERPLVIIVPGSGPTDRNGNGPMGMAASTYRLLAEDLAERGISSLRIDKRGMFGSSEATANADDVTIEDYVADTLGWAEFAESRIDAPCVYLLGHSEGGLVTLAAATQDAALICGIISVAGPGRSLDKIVEEQLKANPANAVVLPDAMAALTALRKGERYDTSAMHPALQGLFRDSVQGFLINAFRYDPAELAGKIDRPLLVLQGERDIQTSVADAELLAQAGGENAELVTLPNVNHVLKTVDSDDRMANIATYGNPDLPLAEGIGSAISEFIEETGNAGAEAE